MSWLRPAWVAAGLLVLQPAAWAQDEEAGGEPAALAAEKPPYQPLSGYGVRLQLAYTGEAAANPSGGLEQTWAYAGQVYVGADADLDQLVGVNGASLHVAVTNRHGDSLSAKAIGNNTSVQEVFGTQNTHLAFLTWRQKMFGDRLELEAGRTVANLNFLASPLYCLFQSNSVCGNPTFVFKTSNFTYFPASSWGGYALARVVDGVYLQAGAYEVNPDRKLPTDHGVSWGIANATGVIAPFEAGFVAGFAKGRLVGHYQLGGWYDGGEYPDPLLDEEGGFAVLTGRPYATRKGRAGGYFRFDQMLWRPSRESSRWLTVFGAAMTRLSGRLVEDRFFEAGLVLAGPFADRAEDRLGFVVNTQRFSDLALENIRVARVSAGGSPELPRQQIMMELAYAAVVFPGILLSPNLQYVVNPDQTSVPFRTVDIPDAFVVGFKFDVNAFALLGAFTGEGTEEARSVH